MHLNYAHHLGAFLLLEIVEIFISIQCSKYKQSFLKLDKIWPINDMSLKFRFGKDGVKISAFFCHSDFTWNQFGESRSSKLLFLSLSSYFFTRRFVILVPQEFCSRQGTTSTCQARPTLSILILYPSIWVSFESKSFGKAISSNIIFKNNTFFCFHISITVN